MIEAQQTRSLTPTRLHQLITSYLGAKAVFSALELGVFEALAERPDTIEGLAERLGLEARPTRILLKALYGLHLVEQEGGVFRNSTETDRYLVRRSPTNMVDLALHQNRHFNHFAQFTEALRENRSITGRVKKDTYANQGAGAGEGLEEARRFARAAHGSAVLQAELLVARYPLSGPLRVADLGCGSCAYSIAYAKTNPELRVIAVDFPPICEVAREYAEQAGVADRFEFRPGDMFQDALPADCDVVLLSHVLDGYAEARARTLLQRIGQCVRPGTKLLIHSHLPSRTKVAYPYLLNLILFANTDEGEVHDEPEISSWLADAGFQEIEGLDVSSISGLVVCRKY